MTETHAVNAPDPAEAGNTEALVDSRVRGLLERYLALAGGTAREVETDVLAVTVPDDDRALFHAGHPSNEDDPLLIAFSLDALERHPEAEMAVVGSDLFNRLIAAIQTRGGRTGWGVVPADRPLDNLPSFESLALDSDAEVVGAVRASIRVHPLGRLLGRVMIRAGTTVEEHLLASGVHDLTTGARVAPDVETAAQALVAGTVEAAAMPDGLPEAEARSVFALTEPLTHDLKSQVADRFETLAADAARVLQGELARVDRYYRGLLEEWRGRKQDAPDDREQTLAREHSRRRAEEKRRHEVRATVHPVQLEEWRLMVQTARWQLRGPSGRSGVLDAYRALSGNGTWAVRCPTCGSPPVAVSVCRQDHIACDRCGHRCSVCAESFCRDHGLVRCHVDGAPACEAHATVCGVCDRRHCTEHKSRCEREDHAACSACVTHCAICGAGVCRDHAVESAEESTRGRRVLCRGCAVYCEGQVGEPVGRDEATACASCDQFVCDRHQATCAVDDRVHCSTHLRRSDHSRRLICETHVGHCAEDPAEFVAVDEVASCVSCRKKICNHHAGVCVEDDRRYCRTHLLPLEDRPGKMGCPEHRAECHITGRAYTPDSVPPCPACDRPTHVSKLEECSHCERRVCVEDWSREDRRCSTCRALHVLADPPDDVLRAALRANDGEPLKVKEWKIGQDARDRIVDLDLGWGRSLVVVMPHALDGAETVVRHGWLGKLFG